MVCADTAPTPSSNIAAVVDINRRILMDVSSGQSAIVKLYGCMAEVRYQQRPRWLAPFQTLIDWLNT
jgi:hypothetical protein